MSEHRSYRPRLQGKRVLITGGTSGIGQAVAELCVAERATVVVTGRDSSGTASSTAAAGGYSFVRADHTVAEDCGRAVAQSAAILGGLDVLFNNAGLVLQGTAESTTEAEWVETMALNVTAPWRMCRLAIPLMRQAGGGVIVNCASDWGVVGAENAIAYCTSKGALVQMTRCLALDHARDRIRVNAVCPGDTYVPRWTRDGYYRGSGPVREEDAKGPRDDLPMGRVAKAAEIARAVLFLMCDDSSYMTGSSLVVDGGNTAR